MITFGSARIDERGRISGGKAGDQTGRELSTQGAYIYGGGWDVCIRIKDKVKRQKYIDFIKWACDSKHIGYDQSNRLTLYNELKKLHFSYKHLSKNVECDCSSLVSCGLIVAGFDKINPANTTATLEDDIVKKYPNDFSVFSKRYKNGDHTKISKWWRNGDILNKYGHHVVTVVSGGRKNTIVKATKKHYSGEFPKLPARGYFVVGDKGEEVEKLQKFLVWAGYDIGKCGVDKKYGKDTKKAVSNFMIDCGFKKITGDFGKKSLAKAKKLKK
jgi:hypothetical protein